MTVLVVVVTVLGVLTTLNLFLLLGVVRRLRSMSTSDSAMEPGLPSPGDRIGAFTETALDGDVITEERLGEGRTLVVFLSPNCRPCQLAATELASQDALPPTIVFVHTEPDDPKFAELRGKLAHLGPIAVVSGHSAAARAFGGIAGYPASVLVADGVVVAASMDLAEVLAVTRPELLSR